MELCSTTSGARAVRNLVRSHVPEKVAMEISGHKTHSVFDRYHIVSEDDVVDAGKKLERYFAREKEGGDEEAAEAEKGVVQ